MEKEKSRFLQNFIDVVTIIIGTILMSLSLSLFLIPNKLTAGGLSGISNILYHLAGFPAGVSLFLMNIPLFIISVKMFGKRFGLKTLTGFVSLSFFIDFIEYLSFMQPFTQNRILASIYGGLLFGVGVGIVFKGHGTSGGSDIIAKIINKYLGLSLGSCFIIIDTIVIITTGVIFKDVELVLFCLMILVICSKTVDFVIEGGWSEKGIFIISNKWEIISKRIMNEVPRGVTGLSSEGLFTKTDKKMLYCIVTIRQVERVRRIILEEDPTAFVTIFNASVLQGEGFKRKMMISDN